MATTEGYDSSTDRWQTLPPTGLHDGEDVPSAAALDRSILVRFFGQFALFSTRDERWHDLTQGAPSIQVTVGPVPVGDAFLLFGLRPDKPFGTIDSQPMLVAYRPELDRGGHRVQVRRVPR
jgi:hypothetical protein